jgi:hypothetical protein
LECTQNCLCNTTWDLLGKYLKLIGMHSELPMQYRGAPGGRGRAGAAGPHETGRSSSSVRTGTRPAYDVGHGRLCSHPDLTTAMRAVECLQAGGSGQFELRSWFEFVGQSLVGLGESSADWPGPPAQSVVANP